MKKLRRQKDTSSLPPNINMILVFAGIAPHLVLCRIASLNSFQIPFLTSNTSTDVKNLLLYPPKKSNQKIIYLPKANMNSSFTLIRFSISRVNP